MENWDDPRIFLAVLRAGSTLGAAKALGIAQTTVARRVDALEQALGLTLFARDTRGFHATAAAMSLAEGAAAMERAAGEFYRNAEQTCDAQNQVIRVTTAHGIAAAIVNDLIAEFSERHPDARFDVLNTQGLLDLTKGEADVAIRYGRRNAGGDVLCRKLFETQWGVYCSRRYAEKHGAPRTPEALAGHRVIWYDETFGTPMFKAWRDAHVPPAAVITRCATVPSMLNAIAGGLGVGPADEISALENDPPFTFCFEMPDVTPIWLLISPEAIRRPLIRAFGDLVAKKWVAAARDRVPLLGQTGN